MRALLILCILASASGCTYQGKKYNNGENWIVNGKFILKCVMPKEGSWKTEIVGCIVDGDTEIAVNGSKIIGQYKWTCLDDGNGLVSVNRTLNPYAKCGDHPVGSVWQEDHFELICAPGGQKKLHNCIASNGDKISPNDEKLIGDYLMKCVHYPNGTVTLTRKQTEVKCVDSNGVHHNVGSFWLELERFNKTCTPSGTSKVVNCVAKEGFKVPLNEEFVRDGLKYSCEKTVDGVVHFSAESAASEAV